MPIGPSRLGFNGPVPIDRGTQDASVEGFIQLPATLAASVPFEVIIGQNYSRNPITALDSASLISTGAIVADSANYLTFQVMSRGIDGTGTAVLGSFSTQTSAQGAIAAYVPVSFVLDRTQAMPQSGSVLTIQVVKVGSGQALPACAIQIRTK